MLRGFTKSIVLSFLIFTVSCGQNRKSQQVDDSNQIVGGKTFRSDDSLPNNVVMIKIGIQNPKTNVVGFSYCTGVLIAESYVLTAAHCVKFDHIVHSEIIFPLSKTSEYFNPARSIVHAGYKTENLYRDYDQLRDVALIKLMQTLPEPYTSLPLFNHPLKGPLSFRALGFGQQTGSILKKITRTFELRHITLTTENYDSKLPYFEVVQNKEGICFGDSGGPAVVQVGAQNYILGIAVDVLFNPARTFEPQYEPCLEEAVYLNVHYFEKWIEESIEVLKNKVI